MRNDNIFPETKIAHLGKLISSIKRAWEISQKWDLGQPYRPSHTVGYGSIYLNVEDYQTESKTHADAEYEQEELAAALVWT